MHIGPLEPKAMAGAGCAVSSSIGMWTSILTAGEVAIATDVAIARRGWAPQHLAPADF